MLTKLLPEQVTRYWDILKPAIEASLPPIAGERSDKMNRVLAALIGGSLHCWVGSKFDDKGVRQIEGIVVTKLLYDDVSDTRNLLIYCLFGYDLVSGNGWREGFETLVKWAKSVGCMSMVGYSNVEKIVRVAKRFGGDVDFRFIRFPLTSV